MTVRTVFHSRKDEQARYQELGGDSSESFFFRYLVLCFCALSGGMPSSSAAHRSAVLCYSLLLMQLRGLWEWETKLKEHFTSLASR